MPAESTTPDLVELVQRFNEAWNRRDADAFLSLVRLDVVYRPITTFPDPHDRRGLDQVRRFFMDEYREAFADDFTSQPETIREYGDGVIALLRFTGHAKASGVEISGGVFQVYRFRAGQITLIEGFTDREQALEAVGLSGKGMSHANVEVVQAVLEAWQRDDFDAFLSGTDPTIEWHTVLERLVEGPENVYRGPGGIRRPWNFYRTELEHFEVEAQELRDVGDDRVVLLGRFRWRGLASGIAGESPAGLVISIRDGKVVQSIDYLSHQEALEAAGLKG